MNQSASSTTSTSNGLLNNVIDLTLDDDDDDDSLAKDRNIRNKREYTVDSSISEDSDSDSVRIDRKRMKAVASSSFSPNSKQNQVVIDLTKDSTIPRNSTSTSTSSKEITSNGVDILSTTTTSTSSSSNMRNVYRVPRVMGVGNSRALMGVFKARIIPLLQEERYKPQLTHTNLDGVLLQKSSTTELNTFYVYSNNSVDRKLIGRVDHLSCLKLCRLKDDPLVMKYLTPTSGIPYYECSAPENSSTLPLAVIFYGETYRIASLMQILNSYGFELERVLDKPPPAGTLPSLLSSSAMNVLEDVPSLWRIPPSTTTAAAATTTTTTTASVLQSNIDDILGSMQSTELLPLTETPHRIKTPLLIHQKMALTFMLDLEQGSSPESRMHKLLWQEVKHYFAHRQEKIYKNLWTGRVVESLNPPEVPKGGILADDMGLGKSLTVLSLILYDLEQQRSATANEEESSALCRATLIICPPSVISNWEDQIKEHVGSRRPMNVCAYHGPDRVKDADFLSQHDIVISTFSTMAYEHRQGNSTLHMVHWRRIILDEAHVIKERKTSQAQAAFDLRGSRRWCLSATPIQNRIDDLFSLIKFIGIPPFDDYKWWDMEVRKQAERGQMKKIQTLVKAITLRRMKNQKLNGKPVVELPQRKDNVWYIELTERERKQYETFLGDAKEALKQVYRRGKGFENGGYAMMFEKMLRLRQICVHPALLPRKEVTDSSASPESGLLGTAGTFSQEKANDVYRLMKESGDDNCSNCLIEFSEQDEGNEENSPVGLECGRLLCVACFNALSTSGKPCETCTQPVSQHNKYSVTKWKTTEEPSTGLFDFFGGFVESPETAESIINITGNTGPLGPDEMSSKFKALIEDLMGHVAKGTKSVVFSQWTSSLSLLEPHLKSFRINYLRFDGKMTLQERRQVLDKFRDSESNCCVLLVSLRAGGVGLNLTVASRVYLIDPWFNFSVENQAIERVYRIGQTKEVETVRLVIKNSIEEKIIEIQEKKAKMAREALMDRNTSGTKHEKSLRGEDIEFLLK